MGDILLSIVIPVYNAKEYLPVCLDSIIPQIKDDSCEIVLVDDGSIDGSETICDEYAKRYSSFVSVYHNVNHGLLYTRHYGVLKANGKYIMNCDADDMLVITDEDKTFLVYNQLPSETSGLNVMYKDIKNNETYTLSGRKLDKPQKGINIAKGKKFVVK